MEDKIILLCITETHQRTNRIRFPEEFVQIEETRMHNDKKGGGLMITFKNNPNVTATRETFNDAQMETNDILEIKAKVYRKAFTIILVYFDVKDKTRNGKIRQRLINRLSHVQPHDKIVLLGDFNGHLGFIGPQDLNCNGRLILELMERFNLVLLNGDDKCKGTITRSQREENSAIDFILVNERMYEDFIEMNIDEDKELFDLSDHCLLRSSFVTEKTETKYVKNERNEQYYYKLNSEELKTDFLNKMEEDINMHINMEGNAMENLETMMRQNADDILKKTFKRRTTVDGKSLEPVWFTREIKEKINQRKKYNRLKRNEQDETKKAEYYELYKKNKLEARLAIMKSKKNYEEKLTEEIKNNKNSGRRWWEQINKLRGKGNQKKAEVIIYENGNPITDKTKLATEMGNYWKAIYQKGENKIHEIWNTDDKQRYREKLLRLNDVRIVCKKDTVEQFFPAELEEHMTTLSGNINSGEKNNFIEKIEYKLEFDWARRHTIHENLIEHYEAADCAIEESRPMRNKMKSFEVSKDQVTKQLKKVKNKKQAGPDELKGELFKWMGERETCLDAITSAINEIATSTNIPLHWKRSKTVMVPRTKEPTVSDLRPIALTNCGYKIFMSLAKEQLIEHLTVNGKINDLQAGFTSGRRIEDNLLIMKYCIESSYKEKVSLILTAIDFSKAFDSVDRKSLIHTLMKYECDPNLTDIISRLYKEDTTKIFLDGEEITDMEITAGIRQGCTGSPQLFIMVINVILEKICSTRVGFKTKELYLPALFFADDGILIANTIEEMTVLIRVLKQASAESGLAINVKKCKSIIFNMKENELEQYKKIEGIEVVKEIKYLGIKIVNKRQCFSSHKEDKLQLARKFLNVMYSVISGCTNKLIVGKMYWKSIALPSILYGSAVIDWSRNEMQTLQRIENTVWRGLLGAPGYTPNTVLQGEIGTSTVETRDMKIKLGYIKHIIDGKFKLGRRVLEELTESQLDKRWISKCNEYLLRLGMNHFQDLAALKPSDIKKEVNKYDEKRWRIELESKTTVKLYAENKQKIQGEEKLYSNDFRSILLFRCRSNTLKLGWRNEYEGGDTRCKICDEPEVETLEHFLQQCTHYEEIRNRYRLNEDDNAAQLLGFKNSTIIEIERLKEYIGEIWKARRVKLKA